MSGFGITVAMQQYMRGSETRKKSETTNILEGKPTTTRVGCVDKTDKLEIKQETTSVE